MSISIDETSVPDISWAVYTDEGSGQDYYYNRETQATQWDAPSDFIEWRKAAVERYLKSINSVWRIGLDARGKFFYFNKATEKSEWAAPPEVVEVDAWLKALTQRRREDFDAAGAENLDEVEAVEEQTAIFVDDYSQGDVLAKESPAFVVENVVDAPATQLGVAAVPRDESRQISSTEGAFTTQIETKTTELPESVDYNLEIEKLEARLTAPDAIMESDVLASIEKYMRLTKKAPEVVIKMLSSSYVGYAKMAEMVADWLSLVRGAPSGTVHESVRKFVRGEVSSLCFQKFDKAAVDSVVRAYEAIPQWLVDMMRDPLWRRLLIQLYDANKTSAFLSQCVRHIASLGHHEEISQIVQDADYFIVFSNVLEDLVSQLTTLNEADIESRTENLKKLCVHSEYLFLYAQAYLAAVKRDLELVHTKKRKLGRFVLDRIDRFQEDLERGCVWDYSTNGSDAAESNTKMQFRVFGSVLSNSTNVSNKLDGRSMFALKMTNNLGPVASSQGTMQREICDVFKSGCVEELHLKRFTQHIFGISDRIESVSLTAPEISKAFSLEPTVMRALIHYKFVQYIVEALIHPKRSVKTRSSIERTAAILAVIPLLRSRLSSAGSPENQEASLESMRSQFHSLLNLRTASAELLTLEFAGGSAFEKKTKEIVTLQQSSPMSSFCILHWIHGLVTDVAFLESPSYVSVYTALLQMVVTAIDTFPSQHPDCFALLQIMYHYKAKQEDESTGRSIEVTTIHSSDLHLMKKSNSLFSALFKIVSIKRDVVECLVHLMGRGYCCDEPFQLITSEVPAADASLMRHTALLLLSGMEPPLSRAVDGRLVAFLENPNVLRSLSTKHFTEKGLPLLSALQSTLTSGSPALAARVAAVIAHCERVS